MVNSGHFTLANLRETGMRVTCLLLSTGNVLWVKESVLVFATDIIFFPGSQWASRIILTVVRRMFLHNVWETENHQTLKLDELILSVPYYVTTCSNKTTRCLLQNPSSYTYCLHTFLLNLLYSRFLKFQDPWDYVEKLTIKSKFKI